MSDQSNREEAIVEAVLALPPAERGACLDKECAGDMALRQLVEALLRAHHQLGRLREQPTETSPKGTFRLSLVVTEKPGDRIGHYKLLQQIGEGGCGTVYMAEQEEPVRRRVALKVVKLGMDTKAVVARFEAERQALALMEHPNIAKVLDAGATDTGRPFFVMELVKGIPITRYCDENKLDTRQRLDLFIQVCQAVQHAHQKGIIHRDIKPSNILVADHDGVPVPKVIDFGIAKATSGQTLTDKTLFTAFEQFIGTPAYMSPEQAKLSGLDIDTRSDIYSLGVLLYELLTGRTPFDVKRLVKAGIEEVCRIIREEEPPRPSTKLSTLDAAEQTTVARQRHSDPPKLAGLIRGDLDWIVMKTLEKDRNRRYETANGLAMDLRRFLNEEPVVARPPSNFYRFQKLVRRNKLAFAAVGGAMSALLIGLAVSTWLFVRERIARQRVSTAEQKAKTAASKSEQVAQFLKDMLAGVGPSVASGRDATLLRELLDKTATRVARDLTNQPEIEVDLRNTIGEVYRALGEHEKAAQMHREALNRVRSALGYDHPAVPVSLNDLAGALLDLDQFRDAESLSREAVTWFEKRGTNRIDLAASLDTLASVFYSQGSRSNALALNRKVLALRKEALGPHAVEVAQSLNNLALVLRELGSLPEAVNMFEEAIVIWRQPANTPSPDLATALNNLGLVLADEGHLPEAESKLSEALEMWRKLIGKDEHIKVAESLDNLGAVLRKEFRLPEAQARHREALELKRKIFGEQHTSVATSLHNLAQALTEQGHFAEAELEQRKALAIFQNASNTAFAAVALNNLGNVLYRQGRMAESEMTYRDSLTMQKDPPQMAITLDSLSFLLGQEEKLEEAELKAREAFEMRLKLYPEGNPAVARSHYTLGSIFEKQHRLPEAEQAYKQALALRRQFLGDQHPEVARSLHALSVLLQRQGREAEAGPLASEALAIFEKKIPDDWQTFSSRSLLGASFAAQGNYAEAEPLLLSGYDGMRQREESIPPDGKPRLKETCKRLVQLYESWGKPEKAAEWRSKALDLEKPQAKGRADVPNARPR